MIINLELLDGTICKFEGVFYLLQVAENRLQICELFTGISCRNSEQEAAILDHVLQGIESQS